MLRLIAVYLAIVLGLGVTVADADTWEETTQQLAEDLTEMHSALNEVQAASIYSLAYGQCPKIKDMEAGCPPEWHRMRPTIYSVPPHVMCALVRAPEGCAVQGLFLHGEIYVSDQLDFSNAFDASTLLHEYIHYFQWLKRDGEEATVCEDWLQMEKEAHRIHAHVLDKVGDQNGARIVRFAMQNLRC